MFQFFSQQNINSNAQVPSSVNFSNNRASQAKEALSFLSVSGSDGIWIAFLAGVAISCGNVQEQQYPLVVDQIQQAWWLSKEKKKTVLFDDFTTQLMKFTCKDTLNTLERLNNQLLSKQPFEQKVRNLEQPKQNMINDQAISNIIQQDLLKHQLQQTKNQIALYENQISSILENQLIPQNSKNVRPNQSAFSIQKRLNQEAEQNKNWKCEICLDPMQDKEYWPLTCSDSYHRECLAEYFNSQIASRHLPLVCPNRQCKQEIQYSDVKEILEPKDFSKFEEFSLNNFIDNHGADMSWCPSAGCQYAFVLEEGQTMLVCPLCQILYCLNCRCMFHIGKTCKEYQASQASATADKQFQSFVRGQKFKQCLKCQMWVEKNQGCNHMTCRCGCQFCYRCGGPYNNCECTKNNQ